MQQFDLSIWLKDKSRKVVTRTGEPVEIINYEVKGDYCIYAKATWQDGETFNICTTSNGEAYEGEETAYDLFFADEEEELTKFEKELQIIISDASHWTSDDGSISTCCLFGDKEIKKISGQLLDLARKEIFQDLPKWKDSWSTGDNTKPQIIGDCLVVGDNLIHISDLVNKLPKEE